MSDKLTLNDLREYVDHEGLGYALLNIDPDEIEDDYLRLQWARAAVHFKNVFDILYNE